MASVSGHVSAAAGSAGAWNWTGLISLHRAEVLGGSGGDVAQAASIEISGNAIFSFIGSFLQLVFGGFDLFDNALLFLASDAPITKSLP